MVRLKAVRSAKQFSMVFGPPETSELLKEIQFLPDVPSDAIRDKVSDLVKRNPLSHNLRLMSFAALMHHGFDAEALNLMKESLLLYPESPLLIDRYLAVSTELAPEVRRELEARSHRNKKLLEL